VRLNWQEPSPSGEARWIGAHEALSPLLAKPPTPEGPMSEIARKFAADLNEVFTALLATPPSLFDKPWREGGWTRKQIVGHLLDSAANNRQRFVRATLDGTYAGPGYAQDAWVDLNGYRDLPWEMLLNWWQVEHEMLKMLVSRIPADRMGVMCVVGENPPVTLRFLIEDYIAHQRHHLKQIQAPEPPK
jgi:hypothetical protein